ncbi:MAG: SDR family NAD(P)-dependent oxidoreductase, partial [Clostridia bacterium]|nr:SDR family NAD(P)-dependent oxidoreductase [Clostridia bacterium]
LIEKYDCKVLGIARSRDALLSLSEELGDKADKFVFLTFDISNRERWIEFAQNIPQNTQYDILINNAGVMPEFKNTVDYEDFEFEHVIEINLLGAYYSTKALLPHLKKGERCGVVNISSSSALCPLAGTSAYSASKSALKAFSECLSAEEGKSVYIGYACPGFTKTNLFRSSDGFYDSKLINALCSSAEKMTAKILKGIDKRKRRMVFGADARLMQAFYKIAPTLSAPVISKVMEKSSLSVFGKMFDKNTKK